MGAELKMGRLFSFIRVWILGQLVMFSFFSGISSKPSYPNFSNENYLKSQSLGQAIELPQGLVHYIVDACSFADQASVDDAFYKWVSYVQDEIEKQYEGYEEVSITNNSLQVNIPELCVGGAVTVLWVVATDVGTSEIDAIFDLIPSEPIILADPERMEVNSCDIFLSIYHYDDAQAVLGMVITDWVSEQTLLLESTLAGGCDLVLHHNYTSHNIDICTGGSVTVTYTIEDRCQTVTVEATFILTPPDPIIVQQPIDLVRDACEFFDYDHYTAQSNLDAAIANWVQEQTDAFVASISSGCSPEVTNDYVDQSIDFCTGGIITVTWTITDWCEDVAVSATFTLNPPDELTWTYPVDEMHEACNFENLDLVTAQANLNAAIDNWFYYNLTNIEVSGGCSPVVTSEYFDNRVIDFCTGGSLTITWTITDLCEEVTVSATFTLNPPVEISVYEPEDTVVYACDFISSYGDDVDRVASQANLNAAFDMWVDSVTDNFQDQVFGGCDPVATPDLEDLIHPDICGDSFTIIWTIEDICFTHKAFTRFYVVPPEPISYFLPDNETWDASNFANQEEFESAFGEWIISINTEIESNIQGGCYPTMTHNASEVSLPSLSDGGTIAVTWTIFDICEMYELIVEVQLDASTSVTELTIDDGILIYPNPAKGVLHVQLNDWTTKLSSVKIYDTLGALHNTFVLENSGSKVTLDIAALSPGTYILEVQTGNTSIRRQFIVQ